MTKKRQQLMQQTMALEQEYKQQTMSLDMAKQQREMSISMQASHMSTEASQYKMQIDMQQKMSTLYGNVLGNQAAAAGAVLKWSQLVAKLIIFLYAGFVGRC